ncbi:MAG: GntR family transcriptional regulator [Victivallaceae bacterium]|nr:GntR family transcriptional regulator [Victivallaceae bacterium]
MEYGNTVSPDNPLPLYHQIKLLIIGDIQKRKLQKGDCIDKELDLCQKYKVSRITIRRAIADLVRENLLYRISGRGTYVARALELDDVSLENENQITLVVPDVQDLVSSVIYSGIEAEADRRGYEVIIHSAGRNIDRENYYLSRLIKRNSLGAVILPNWGKSNAIQIFELKRHNFPFVLIDRYFRDIETDYVITDNLAGAFELVSYLISLGHKRIGFIGGLDATSGNDRLEGYKKALSRHGLIIEEDLIVSLDPNRFASSQMEPEGGGYIECKKLLKLKSPPTAVFAACDPLAYGAMRTIKDFGLKVPEDISVVGFDDLKFSALLDVPLTTAAQPFREIGETAMRILLDKIEGKDKDLRQIILKPRLIVRKSTTVRKPAT